MDLFFIYLICFGGGLLFAIVSALFAGVADSHHGDVHSGDSAHLESAGDPGIGALSPTSVGSFATAFGGFGMIFSKIEATSSPWISVPLAAVAGFAIAAGVIALFRTVFRHTQSSSEARVGRLSGLVATVISPIPENGVGEIAYVQAGSRYTAPAREENGIAVSVGKSVKITRVVGTQYHVTAI